MKKRLLLVDDNRSYPFWKRKGFPDLGALKVLWQIRSEGPCGDPIYLTKEPGYMGNITDFFRGRIKTEVGVDETLFVVTDEDFNSGSSSSGGVALLNALCAEPGFGRGCVYSTDPGNRLFRRPLVNLKYELLAENAGAQYAEAIEILDYLAKGTIPKSRAVLETNETGRRLRASIHDLEGLVNPLRSDLQQVARDPQLLPQVMKDYFGDRGYLRSAVTSPVHENLLVGVTAVVNSLCSAGILTEEERTSYTNPDSLTTDQLPAVPDVVKKMAAAKERLEYLIRELRAIRAGGVAGDGTEASQGRPF